MAKLHTVIITSNCDRDDIENNKIIIDENIEDQTVVDIRENITLMAEDYICEPEHAEFISNILKNIKEIKVVVSEFQDHDSQDTFNPNDGHSTIDTAFTVYTLNTEIKINDKEDNISVENIELFIGDMLDNYLPIGSNSEINITSDEVKFVQKNICK
jgi:hypothetical protein